MATTRLLSRILVASLVLCVALLALSCRGGERHGALGTGVPPPPDVKPAKWNQERVTAIAVELAQQVDELREAVRASPVGKTIGSGQENAMLRLNDRLRLLKNESRHLANELKAGQGRDATLPVYERVGNLARDAREEARKMFLPEPIMAKIVGAGAAWSRLTPYYIGV